MTRPSLAAVAGADELPAFDPGDRCVITATVTKGIMQMPVLARSAFHHSMNYRSVVLLGTAAEVDDVAEKRAAFRALVEHVVPGRYPAVRAPTDDESDYTWPVWAGVIPLAVRPGTPIPDPRLDTEQPIPPYATAYVRE